jgi:hypothetical protein
VGRRCSIIHIHFILFISFYIFLLTFRYLILSFIDRVCSSFSLRHAYVHSHFICLSLLFFFCLLFYTFPFFFIIADNPLFVFYIFFIYISLDLKYHLYIYLFFYFLWTLKYHLCVLLYFLVVKLILVIYPIKFTLKMTNNIRDITTTLTIVTLKYIKLSFCCKIKPFYWHSPYVWMKKS